MADESSQATLAASKSVADSSASLWTRFSDWAAEHKAVVYTVAGVTLVATAGGIYYYVSGSPGREANGERKSKSQRRKAKKEAQEATEKAAEAPSASPMSKDQKEEELLKIDEAAIEKLTAEERNDYAAKLKAVGNDRYKSKAYNKALEYYDKAILCKPEAVFYSNRAACYSAMSNWEKVIEDTTAAISLNNLYAKALNRRANAYEQVDKYSEALLDFTACCIIEKFENPQAAASVERLLKKVAEAKAKEIMKNKEKRLPSSMFVTNYLQSFRTKPLPAEVEDASKLEADSGKAQLRAGLVAMSQKTSTSYDEAATAFDKALELNDLGSTEAYAYNLRGTFRYLKGQNDEALADLTKSIELDPSLTQSYIKRASMHLEQGSQEAAAQDFATAMEKDANDPDIYYHRAQLHFILGEFKEAGEDYQQSIKLDNDFIFSHIQLGVTQYKMGSIASSMATFRKCRKSFPRVPDVFNYNGELLLDQQKYQEAVEMFDQAIELEQASKSQSMNVLPLINKALALFQWTQRSDEAENLCRKALEIDPDCDIAVATMAQLLLQQNKVDEALKCFERAAELSRTEGEIVNALSYAEATRTQLSNNDILVLRTCSRIAIPVVSEG